MEKYPLDVPLYLAGRENLLEKTKKMIREKDNPIVPSQWQKGHQVVSSASLFSNRMALLDECKRRSPPRNFLKTSARQECLVCEKWEFTSRDEVKIF